jgi:hypothetical protein
MRLAGLIAVALVAGLVAGVVLSEVIGIIGFLLFHDAVGIKYLPIYLAIAGAVAVAVVDTRIRRKSK